MNEILIIIGQNTMINRWDRVDEVIADFKVKCHVMSNVWAVRTHDSAQRVAEALAAGLGPDEQFLVAHVPHGWMEQNALSRTSCFA